MNITNLIVFYILDCIEQEKEDGNFPDYFLVRKKKCENYENNSLKWISFDTKVMSLNILREIIFHKIVHCVKFSLNIKNLCRFIDVIFGPELNI